MMAMIARNISYIVRIAYFENNRSQTKQKKELPYCWGFFWLNFPEFALKELEFQFWAVWGIRWTITGKCSFR